MWKTALEMDESETVSSWRVSMPDDWAWVSLDVLRAVAKTRQPALWKAMARAQPRPPSEQPVIRTVLFAKTMVIFVMQIGAGLDRTRCIWEDTLNLLKAFASRAPPFLLFNNEFFFYYRRKPPTLQGTSIFKSLRCLPEPKLRVQVSDLSPMSKYVAGSSDCLCPAASEPTRVRIGDFWMRSSD